MPGRRWTAADDATLRQVWGEYSERHVRAAFRGRRTWKGIYERAKALGLPFGIPQGCVSIQAAADACGFTWRGLASVLAWAGVVVRRAYTEPCPGKPRSRAKPNARRFVDADEAREAVERWLATESINDAVRRTGVRFPTLRPWLAAAGLLAAERFSGAGGGSYRLDPAAVDVVVAAHRRVAA